jgi:Concanavalin A-like lectin/glucanases superfamily/Secretion system C-terminal sorting domain
MKKTSLSLLLVLSWFLLKAQTPSYVPLNGLNAWYPFNGNANDESLAGNNGVNYGATLTTDRFGISNAAYSFNGTSNYVDCPTIPMFTSSITLSAWFKRTNSSSSYQALITKWTQLTINAEFWFGTIGQQINYSFAGPSSQAQTQGNPFALNQWNHVAITYTSNGLAVVYLNGAVISSNQFSPYPLSVSSPVSLKIGTESIGYRHWNGLIDDVGIWNRPLTAQEVQDLYNAAPCSPNLVTSNPVSQSINSGQNIKFSILSNSSTATYRWQTNTGFGWQSLSNAGQYSGVFNDTLTVSNVSINNNNHLFRCIVKDGACRDTSTIATLTISTGISSIANSSAISVSPNPSNDNYYISKTSNERLDYRVSNALGEIILTGQLTEMNTVLSLSNFPQGIYFLIVNDEQKTNIRLVKL